MNTVENLENNINNLLNVSSNISINNIETYTKLYDNLKFQENLHKILIEEITDNEYLNKIKEFYDINMNLISKYDYSLKIICCDLENIYKNFTEINDEYKDFILNNNINQYIEIISFLLETDIKQNYPDMSQDIYNNIYIELKILDRYIIELNNK